jgi:hypothetical protein
MLTLLQATATHPTREQCGLLHKRPLQNSRHKKKARERIRSRSVHTTGKQTGGTNQANPANPATPANPTNPAKTFFICNRRSVEE